MYKIFYGPYDRTCLLSLHLLLSLYTHFAPARIPAYAHRTNRTLPFLLYPLLLLWSRKSKPSIKGKIGQPLYIGQVESGGATGHMKCSCKKLRYDCYCGFRCEDHYHNTRISPCVAPVVVAILVFLYYISVE